MNTLLFSRQTVGQQREGKTKKKEMEHNPGLMMGFEENNNSFGSLMMMMPQTAAVGSQTHMAPFHPLPCTNYHQTLNQHGGGGGSSMIQQDSHQYYSTTTTNIMSNGVYFMEGTNDEDEGSCSAKAKIMAHPHYQRLLAAYVNCHKIGAPSEVVAKLEQACASVAAIGSHGGGRVGDDPALDQFMEAYCEMLNKYEQELSKPFKEAHVFLSRIECQLNALNFGGVEEVERTGSSEGEFDVHTSSVDPQAEDQELKGQLLRRYSGYLGSLKQEFMKKRKKGKLPREARQQLLEWWSRHYKWPYPSEAQKLALAEATGLDQKQINNWFINQRKRHWKPSEDMQFVVMDAAHPYYMGSVLGNHFPMDLSSALL